jgi:hypothetical protein
MSKKYVPSFLREGGIKDGSVKQPLKDDSIREVVDPPTRNFSQERNNSNAFSRVSHDHKKEKPVIEVPKLAPATLASITSLNGETTKGGGSFASKFAEQVRISEDPNYQKPVDLSSADDFPALGAVKKNNVVIPPFKPPPMERRQPTEKPSLTELKTATSAPSFAEMASLWAKKKEDEDRENAEFQRRKELEEEKMRQAARLMKKVPVLGSIGRRGITREEGDEEENVYINPDDQSSLGGGSNYEYEEEESFEGEDDEDDEGHEDGEEDEYNPNAGWDGRRKEDLY